MLSSKNNVAFSPINNHSTQTPDDDITNLAQQAMAENLTPQETEAIYALLQGESTQQTTQPHPLTGEMSELWQQIEEAPAPKNLSPEEQRWVSTQIQRWKRQEERQQFLEATFGRAKLSPIFGSNAFHHEIRTLGSVKKLTNRIEKYFKDLEHFTEFESTGLNLTLKGYEVNKMLSRIESSQGRLIFTAQNMKEQIKDAESARCHDLQEMKESTIKRTDELKTSIRDNELEQAFAAEFNPGYLIALQARQTNLQRQQRREQIGLSRLEGELQRLQAPWPEPHPGLGASVEPQAGPSTKARTRSGPSLER